MALAGPVAMLVSACLSRPVTDESPATTKVYTKKQRVTTVDKIDILLAIDDSASMGDKQKFLAKAIPNLIGRLVAPNCVDEKGQSTGKQAVVDSASPAGRCDVGKPAFLPITDIHVGVVTSSMGAFGSSANCGSSVAERNLRGHLMSDDRIAGIRHEDAGFLAYFPDSPSNAEKRKAPGFTAPSAAYTSASDLQAAVGQLVAKVGETGCGAEAQLEAVYRFLAQSDPWDSVEVDGNSAKYVGIDREILAQRKAFLRPDSLVAVLLLTDENDSAVDPLSARGFGWSYMASSWPRTFAGMVNNTRTDDRYGRGFTAPGGTTGCKSGEGACLPCWASGASSDPNCKATLPQSEDPMGLRAYDMKRRFGVDPQYPLSRYIRGFRDALVPNRKEEHDDAGNYTGDVRASCTNPLFASELPAPSASEDALCALPPGTRESSDIFFAVIGGVPNDLAAAANGKGAADAWVKILGKQGPYGDRSGIDARMIASQEPRTEAALRDLGYDPSKVVGGPSADLDWDAVRGDLMFACTFDLPPDLQREPTAALADSTIYDCSRFWDAPLCDKRLAKNDGTDRSLRRQVKGKAYPTTRELAVARALDNQGIVGSICAEKATGDPNDPAFGYNPAVATIVDRISIELQPRCLPEALPANEAGVVPCSVLERLRAKGPESLCDAPSQGRKIPDLEVLSRYIAEAKAIDPKTDMDQYPICELIQRPVTAGQTCAEGEPGFCYVQPTNGTCSQAIVYANNTFAGSDLFRRSTVDLRCLTTQ